MSSSGHFNNIAIGYQSGFNCTTGSQNIAIGTGAFMSYSVLWCPACGKIYIRHIVNTSIATYLCGCKETLIQIHVDHRVIQKVLKTKNTESLSKEELVEILV